MDFAEYARQPQCVPWHYPKHGASANVAKTNNHDGTNPLELLPQTQTGTQTPNPP